MRATANISQIAVDSEQLVSTSKLRPHGWQPLSARNEHASQEESGPATLKEKKNVVDAAFKAGQ